MQSNLGGRIVAFSTTLLLSATSLASAQMPSRNIRNSPILPYLLDNPNDNSLVRVRCVSRNRQEVSRKRHIIRDSLLRRPNIGDHRSDTVTIEIEGSCRNIRIHVQDDSDSANYPVYNPYLDDDHVDSDNSWLTRPGSGWDLLLNPQNFDK
jgi:hypothetical protein